MISFGIEQVEEILGTDKVRLNKLGAIASITASVDKGGIQGKRRHFSVQDVCGLGLALWLWHAGLRGSAISDVMGHKVSQSLMSNLTSLTRIRREAERRRLLVAVNFRRPEKGHAKANRHYQAVWLAKTLEHPKSKLRRSSGVVVPVGGLLHLLDKALEVS